MKKVVKVDLGKMMIKKSTRGAVCVCMMIVSVMIESMNGGAAVAEAGQTDDLLWPTDGATLLVSCVCVYGATVASAGRCGNDRVASHTRDTHQPGTVRRCGRKMAGRRRPASKVMLSIRAGEGPT